MNARTLPRPGKIIQVILLLALVAGMVLPAVEALAQAGSAAAVDTGTLNIRTGPGVIFAIIGKLQFNEQITLIGKASSGTWVQIRTVGGNVGWVNSIHLRTFADYNLLPVTYDTSVIVPPQTVPPPGSGSGVPSGPTVYVVRAGDTLQNIARRFGTTWQAIATANNLPNANFIFTGQRLVIPAAPARPPQTYVVRAGDTLFSIALRFGTTVQVIQTANNLPNPNAIFAGQTLTIP